MNINITCRQFEITPSIREYVEQRINALEEAEKALKITSVTVVMDREKGHFKSNIGLVCKFHSFDVITEDIDLYKSFDAALTKVGTQLIKLKEKIHDHRAEPVREAEARSIPKETDAE